MISFLFFAHFIRDLGVILDLNYLLILMLILHVIIGELMRGLVPVTFITLGVLLSGCSATNQRTPLPVEGECQVDQVVAPDWVCGSYTEDTRYIAVGSAVKSKLGYDFTRKEALTNARSALASKIDAQVKTKVESYRRSTGISDDSSERVITAVSREVSEMALNQTQQISYWEDVEHNTVYILIAMDKQLVSAKINAELEDAVQSDANQPE